MPPMTLASVRPHDRPMQLFEELYRLLVLAWPGLAKGKARACATADVSVSVLEHSRYTTTLRLGRRFSTADGLVPDVSMTVRAYHDARVAEVIAYQGCERLPAPYTVQGDPRYVPDERRQVNRLLLTLLHHDAFAVQACQWPAPDEV